MTTDNCQNPCLSCSSPIAGAANLGLTPLDPDFPLVNLSAEAPDVDLFVGINNPFIGPPPLTSQWYAVGCLGFCLSTISQADADLCAAQQAAQCVVPNWPDDGNPNPNPGGDPPFPPVTPTLFFNTPQSCTFTCPDGVIFNFNVRAGVFSALNQATADSWAASYACQQAAQNYLCMSSPASLRACSGGAYEGVITLLTPNKPATGSVTNGSLPPGMALFQGVNPLNPTLIISGTCTVPGSYAFVVTAVDSHGNTGAKGYTIVVFGISDAQGLPNATDGNPYSHLFTVGGTPVGAMSFTIVGGSLPPGLSLDSTTGEITGTPTSEGAYQFTVRLEDQVTQCDRVFDMFVDPPVGACVALWSTIDWDPPVIDEHGSGVASASAAANSCTFATSCGGSSFESNGGSIDVTGHFDYVGPESNCCVNVNVASTTTGGGLMIVTQDGNIILLADFAAPGIYPIVLAESLVAVSVVITIAAHSGSAVGEGQPPASCGGTITFGEC